MNINIDVDELAQVIAKKVFSELTGLLGNQPKRNREDTIYTVVDVSKYLSVDPKWIYQQTHLKTIPHFKLNNQLRFRKAEIDKWIDSHKIPSLSMPGDFLKQVR